MDDSFTQYTSGYRGGYAAATKPLQPGERRASPNPQNGAKLTVYGQGYNDGYRDGYNANTFQSTIGGK